MRIVSLVVGLFLLAGLAGCAHVATTGGKPVADVAAPEAVTPSVGGRLPLPSAVPAEQLVVVVSETRGTPRARLYLFERVAGEWRHRYGGIPASIGITGFAKPGEKREGDGHTPAGLFPLESVFGYAPSADTRMPYRQATAEDIWVDDPAAPDYNTWTKRGETTATSFEEMLRQDDYYRFGVVIGYNRNPIVKGRGSAIFLHIWRGAGKGTAGCVAVDQLELLHIIRWLDPARHPMILMGTRSDLASIIANGP
jgi:L,D-peptidoglycan transpeptidase YkuD (ErfK/YbiS/YcfS/YnhG family)